MDRTDQLEIDLALLNGFRFECQPGCGLCCYAEPRVEPSDRARLIQIAPNAVFVGQGPDQFLAARPDGGACQFLSVNRCEVHAARPHPCREFPITVHMGRRLQATIVLSCPGVDLGSLRIPPSRRASPSEGLESEIQSLRERIGPGVQTRLDAAALRGRRLERALQAEGRWDDDEDVRSHLRSQLPRPGSADFPVEDPPELADGWEELPLFYDGRSAPLVLTRQIGGWEVWQLRPEGRGETLGVFPPPLRPPALEPEADRLLEAYLGYALERDAFLASAQLDALESEEGSVTDWARTDLATLGAMVLARGAVRAKLRGAGDGLLSERDVADGIRATDLDWLDRPTWGDRF